MGKTFKNLRMYSNNSASNQYYPNNRFNTPYQRPYNQTSNNRVSYQNTPMSSNSNPNNYWANYNNNGNNNNTYNMSMSTNLNTNANMNRNFNDNNLYKNNQDAQRISKKESRRVIANGQYQCQCPDGFEDEAITGEVTIRYLRTNAIVYEGQMFNSEKYGFGVEYDERGNFLYQGQFRADKREGWGKTEEYMGQFKDDLYDGWGKLATDQVIYQGYFSQGKYNGIGIYIHSKESFNRMGTVNGSEVLRSKKNIQEYLLDQISKNKKFFQQFKIDQIYIGQWTKGLKNGSGMLWKSNGSWYNGQFAYDNPHGTGAHFQNKTGSMDTGVFSKGIISKKSF